MPGQLINTGNTPGGGLRFSNENNQGSLTFSTTSAPPPAIPVWTAGGAMINGRRFLAGAGTQNAALAIGGRCSTGNVACTEAYDGSTWSAGGF